MKVLAYVFCGALALTGSAVAAAPAGFASAPKLAPAVAFVAGKPVTVYCAATQYDGEQYAAATGRSGTDLNGSTVPGSSELRLSPTVCTNLRLKLARKPVRDSALGPSILVLVHEAIHDRGETDEAVTDCDAVHEMPRVAVKFFGVKSGAQLRSLMAATWTYRSREPALYRAKC